MRRTGWRSTQDLSRNMEWQHAAEAEILTWTVKALDRNLLPWICVFAPGTIAFVIYAFYLWAAGDVVTAKLVIVSLIFPLFIAYKVVMEKTVFVYRATGERMEICQWQDIPDSVFTFLRALPFVVIGIIAMALISNPALSIAALVGPALVGIFVASVGGGSEYKEIYKRFSRDEFKWCEVRKMLLDRNKGLLALSVDWESKYIDPEEVDVHDREHHRHLYPIYFQGHQEEKVLALFKGRAKCADAMVEGRYVYPFIG